MWTQSGLISKDGNETWSYDEDNANSHLPLVKQNRNVALIVYNPNANIKINAKSNVLGIKTMKHLEVTLHWPSQSSERRFDEEFEHGSWLIGHRRESYIAVRRPCKDYREGYPSCSGVDGRQWYVVVVGNSSTHGSFESFKEVVKASSTKRSYNYHFDDDSYNYYTRISVDGIDLSNSWRVPREEDWISK